MAVRIASMALRVCFVINLILGILFWVNNSALALVPLHMLIGILFVALVWFLGLAQAATREGSLGLMVGTFAIGLLLAIIGLFQPGWLTGSAHWIIQVLHLLVAAATAGIGEAAASRYRRGVAAAAA
ncbi:MAG TPA: hypothetical protein VGP82_26035 [Ktedonobacterales bacterium]|nr:hypothetical protein [Ktedonobacterales bacterium]